MDHLSLLETKYNYVFSEIIYFYFSMAKAYYIVNQYVLSVHFFEKSYSKMRL
jgi:hypothetical protein